MCKKLKFDRTNKWYMHNPAPVPENDTHKLLGDFDIHTDHLISARRPDLIIINKKREFAKLSTMLSQLTTEKNERMWKEGLVPRPCLGIEKAVEHESDNRTNCDWCFWHNNKRIIKSPGGLGSWRTGRDYPNDSITENGQNTEKRPEDLRRLAVIQTPVKNHQLTLM